MARTKDTLSDVKRAAIKRYPRAAEQLPDPSETWERHEIELDENAHRTFSASEVIEVVHRSNHKGHTWRTADGITSWVANNVQPATTPCGNATGIRTITAGEEYTCSCEDCDCRMDRKTAEEVVA